MASHEKNGNKKLQQQYRIALIGWSVEAKHLVQLLAKQQHIQLVAIQSLDDIDQEITKKLKIPTVKNITDLDFNQIDCAVITAYQAQSMQKIDESVCVLLNAGIHVISTLAHQDQSISSRLSSYQPQHDVQQSIQEACQQGQASFHVTGIFPHLMLEQFVLTLAHALSCVDVICIQQSIQLFSEDFKTQQFKDFGFGQKIEDWQQNFQNREILFQHSLRNVMANLYDQNILANLEFKTEVYPITTQQELDLDGFNIAKDSIAALHFVQRAIYQGRILLEAEEYWYVGQVLANQQDSIYQNYQKPFNYSVQIEGEPSIISTQLDFSYHQGQQSPLAQISAQAILHAIPEVCQAPAGVLMHASAPRYQHDERVAGQNNIEPSQNSHTTSAREIKKVIIWGPGEIGGAVVRAALQRKDIQIVGAKVFSPHKHGQDLGVLVGIEPLGIYASTSSAEVLALDADCVIVTPQPRAIVEGLDLQVMEILKSGKNVITSAAYHNVTMPNWLIDAQTPMALLKEALATKGIANNHQEEIALNILKKLEKPLAKFPVLKKCEPFLNKILQPALNKVMPPRAKAAQLLAACLEGRSSLHGTGVHPTFMAERIGLLLANMLPETKHMRFIEAVDFSYMPDGMWGGLNKIGFGLPLSDLDENYIVAKAGDFYYGDVTGNVGHLLFGYDSTQIRVERHFRAIPATEDFKVGSIVIKKGHAAALHMMHKGYVGDHHFFTNEECWYLGPNHEYRGDGLPFGQFQTPISYTLQIQAQEMQMNMQLSMDGNGEFAQMLKEADISTADLRCTLGQAFKDAGVTNPITNGTAMSILDAVHAVCDVQAGIIIDDIKPRLNLIS